MVKRTKSIALAAVAVGLASVGGGALYASRSQGSLPLYVAKVDVIAATVSHHGPNVVAAIVQIVDQAGQGVSGARVTGRFTGCDASYASSDRANEGGFALVKGRDVKCGCVQTFTVTGVTKSGWTWTAPNPLPGDSEQLCD